MGTGGWVQHAACASVDPEIFHLEKGQNPAPAIAVCQRCPVQAPCLDLALTRSQADDYGVWGGFTNLGRRELRRQRKKEMGL